MDDLYEEQFFSRLKKQQEAAEKLKLELIAKRAMKNKKVKDEEEEEDNATVSLSSSIPRRNAECFGFATSTQNSIKNETITIPDFNPENTHISESRSANKDVPKMEADSQSQDDVVFVDRIDGMASQIKVETDISFEEHETCKWDVIQTPVLRAVVRPENIEQLSLNEKESGGRNESLEEKEVEICESRNRSQEIQMPEQELEEEEIVQGGEDLRAESAEEPVAAEAVIVSSVDVQSSPSKLSKPSNNDLLLDEFSRMSTPSDDIAQLWNDPSGGFISDCFPDVDTQNWSTSHDFILGQYGDELMAQYDTIGTNGTIAFPDFYNDQQDMVFTGSVIGSPPHMEMAKDDEPEEYRLRTTHWVENLSMMASDTSSGFQDKSSSGLDLDITPPVLEQNSPVSKFKGRRKTKSKKQGRNVKVKDQSPPTKELVQIPEKITKVTPVKGMFSILFLIQRKLLQKIKSCILKSKVLVTVSLTLKQNKKKINQMKNIVNFTFENFT